jgi:peptide/nickel transport system permease protein
VTVPDPLVLTEAATPQPGIAPEIHEHVSRGRLILRRFLRRKVSVAAIGLLVFLFLISYVAPLFYKWNYDELDFTSLFEGPSFNHWFGTSQTGEDLFAQTMRGLQKSLAIGFLTAILSTGVAAIVGASAGYFGGWTDRIISWMVDLLLVLPSFLLLVLLSPYFQDGSWILFVFLLAAFAWMVTARVVRSMTLSLKEREFIAAARYMGVPARTIIWRHLLPNMASFLIIDATIAVGGTILAETTLSYFGFGLGENDVSLGSLIAENSGYFDTGYWWLYAFPGAILVSTVLAASVIGDGLRDAFDPYSSRAQRHS